MARGGLSPTRLRKCKECGKEDIASLCNHCFLDFLMTAIEGGEKDWGKIFQAMTKKYGKLLNLKSLKVYKEIFEPQKIRRVVTTPEGTRARLVPTLDGIIALKPLGEKRTVYIKYAEDMPTEDFYLTAEGSQVGQYPVEESLTQLPGQSAEGPRVVTLMEGDIEISRKEHPTALIQPRKKSRRGKRKSGSKAPARDYRSPRLDQ